MDRTELSMISAQVKWSTCSAREDLATDFIKLQVRTQDLVKGGPQLLRPKVAAVAEGSHASQESYIHLSPGSFWVFNAGLGIYLSP